MLILSRKIDETLRIGSEITVKVMEINGNQVKIGISAPKGMIILREELYEKTKIENIQNLTTEKPGIDKLPVFIKKKKEIEPTELE